MPEMMRNMEPTSSFGTVAVNNGNDFIGAITSNFEVDFEMPPEEEESNPILEDYLCRQRREFQRQIQLLDTLVKLESTYMVKRQFTKTYLFAITLRLRLGRFQRTWMKVIRDSKSDPTILFDRVRIPERRNYAISTSRHLAKCSNLESQRAELQKVYRDVFHLSTDLLYHDHQISSTRCI